MTFSNPLENRSSDENYTRPAEAAPGLEGCEAPDRFEVRADVRDTAKEYVLYLDVPGMEEDDIRIDADRNSLEVTGCRDFDHDNQDAEEFLMIGRSFGDFRYRIRFEREIYPMEITVRYRRGVLRVRVPKRTADEPCDGNCETCKSEKKIEAPAK